MPTTSTDRRSVHPAYRLLTLCIWVTACAHQWASADTLPPTRINAVDGAEMVLVPEGEFLMGTSAADRETWPAAHPDRGPKAYLDEIPQRTVSLSAYYMYKTEVTVAQFRRFTEATGYDFEWSQRKPAWGWIDDHPMVHMRWSEAAAYAEWAGAALPSEAQWEKAARGGDGRIFPWGNDWPPPEKAGNFADQSMLRIYPTWTAIEGYDDGFAYTAPVGSYPANPYGIHDLAGNVWEWCADQYNSGYYRNAPASDPAGPETGSAYVIRGGSWGYVNADEFRCARRQFRNPNAIAKHFNYLGFRCVVPAVTSGL